MKSFVLNPRCRNASGSELAKARSCLSANVTYLKPSLFAMSLQMKVLPVCLAPVMRVTGLFLRYSSISDKAVRGIIVDYHLINI